jgi:hypothetical protein
MVSPHPSVSASGARAAPSPRTAPSPRIDPSPLSVPAPVDRLRHLERGAVFRLFDANDDGLITLAELQRALACLAGVLPAGPKEELRILAAERKSIDATTVPEEPQRRFEGLPLSPSVPSVPR